MQHYNSGRQFQYSCAFFVSEIIFIFIQANETECQMETVHFQLVPHIKQIVLERKSM